MSHKKDTGLIWINIFSAPLVQPFCLLVMGSALRDDALNKVAQIGGASLPCRILHHSDDILLPMCFVETHLANGLADNLYGD